MKDLKIRSENQENSEIKLSQSLIARARRTTQRISQMWLVSNSTPGHLEQAIKRASLIPGQVGIKQ